VIDSHLDDEFLFVGDYNLPDVGWVLNNGVLVPTGASTPRSVEFVNHFALWNLKQYNSVKNVNSRMLDLILSNSVCTFSVSHCINPLVAENIHHKALFVSLDSLHFKPAHIASRLTRNFRSADYISINNDIGSLNWRELFAGASTNMAVGIFYDKLYGIINKYIPVKKYKNKNNPHWISSVTISILKEKDKFHRKWKRFGSLTDYQVFSDLRRRGKASINNDFKHFVSQTETDLPSNIKRFWTFVSALRKNNSLPSSVTLDNATAESGPEVCSLFSKHFKSVYEPADLPVLISTTSHSDAITITNIDKQIVEKYLHKLDSNKGCGPDDIDTFFIKSCAGSLAEPLYLLYNLSLSEGLFPDRWKHANILPIFKSGDRSDVKNYRPISLLSHFGKLFEAIIADLLSFSVRDRIIEEQHGFVSGKSVISNLIPFVHTINSALDGRAQLDAVYTDFSKAFDKVHHKTLILKLEKFGVHGSLLRWLESYISFRTQCITVNNYKSENILVSSGVPQGSHLGPLLFVIFINDIKECLKNCEFLLFADDLKVFKPIYTADDCWGLQADLDSLATYCNINHLTLNISKCCQITFSRVHSPIVCHYTINNSQLSNVTKVKDLGVIIDNKLLFDAHIDSIVQKSYQMLGFIKRTTSRFNNPSSVIQLYYSFVRSRLEYASVIWCPQYSKYIDSIEKVQQRFVNYMNFKFNRHLHYQPYAARLHHYNLLRLSDRRTLSDMLCLFKIVNGVVESHFSVNFLQFYCGGSGCDTRYSALFRPPSFRTNSNRNSPLIRLMRTYNQIFFDVDLFSQTMASFRRQIIHKFL